MVYVTEYNRILMFKEPVDGKILPGHVIKTENVANEGSCRVKCFIEPNCVSINVGPLDEHGVRICELKNITDESSSQSGLEDKEGHIHYAVEVSEDFFFEEICLLMSRDKEFSLLKGDDYLCSF